MEVVRFRGWACARLVAGAVEALVTLDVGPRVVRLGAVDGPNLLHENEEQTGLKGGDEYRSYGGHRLWVAPESWDVTYYPENEPVEAFEEGDWSIFRSAPDSHGLQRELRIRVAGEAAFDLEHRIHLVGTLPVHLAPWALTVMAPGGECFFPQEPFQSHSDNFLPVRPLVLWGYTDMTDPRWTWGRELVRLRHDANRGPQKVGAFVSAGWAAYENLGSVFLKRFPARAGGNYPDFGCNFETFTRQDMLEVESLGVLETVTTGDHASLREGWLVAPGPVPKDESEAAAFLADLAARCPSP